MKNKKRIDRLENYMQTVLDALVEGGVLALQKFKKQAPKIKAEKPSVDTPGQYSNQPK